jgi:hypothetical protein
MDKTAKDEFREFIQARRLENLLSNLKMVRAKIHRTALSGPYNYRQLEDALGPMKINKAFNPNDRYPNYNTQAYLQIGRFRVVIFTNRKREFYPRCVIEMSYPSVRFLLDLYEKLNKLNVSYVEYAVDLYFDKTPLIREHFETLRRYISFPYQRSGWLLRDISQDEVERMNACYKTPKVTLYERGPDELKHTADGKACWRLADCDRIRIEYWAGTKDLRALEKDEDKKGEVCKLKSFIKNPRFGPMMAGRFRFYSFRSNPYGWPVKSDKYTARDKYNHSGTFHNEYIQAARRGVNARQYREEVPELMGLLRDIEVRAKRFDRAWRLKHRKHKKQIQSQ